VSVSLGAWRGSWVSRGGRPGLSRGEQQLLLHACGYDRYRPRQDRDYVLVEQDAGDMAAARGLESKGLMRQRGGPISWAAGALCFRATPAGLELARRLHEEGMGGE